LELIQKTGIGIEMKKYELELELFHKTRIGIGIDSKTRIGIDSGKHELELIQKTGIDLKNTNWN
jgi:hypothetical protein